jgi:SPP1 family phage portal protein
MIQIRDVKELKPEDIGKLYNIVNAELIKREKLYLRYKRKSSNSGLIFNRDKNDKTIITFEKYIVDIASGYLGGVAPQFTVNDVKDKNKQNLIRKLLDKIVGEENYKEQMEIIIDFITGYNDDGAEHYNLIKDYLLYSGCYERIYENSNNDIVYTRLDPLQTVALYNYNNEIIGIFRTWTEKDLNGKEVQVVELIDSEKTKMFQGSGNQWTEIPIYDDLGNEISGEHHWGDVPAIVCEQEEGEAIFEPVVELIKSYEQLVQNTRNTFQYNDDAKLKVVGYSPINAMYKEVEVKDENGEYKTIQIENPDRKAEDEAVLKAKVFYTPDASGDIGWVEKTINDSAIQNTLKTYIDLIMMMSFVPNITDLGFTKADNNSALQNKYFALSMQSIDLTTQLTKAYKRRWELIFNRINLKKGTNFDFRDIAITIPKNLPQNNDDVVNTWMRLRGLISDSTIIDNLPFDLDPISEQNKIQEQNEQEFETQMTQAQAFNDFTNQGESSIIEQKGGNDNE